MLSTSEDETYYDFYYDDNGNYIKNTNTTNATNFAIGISIGGKFISKKGFVAEIYLGIGKKLFKENKMIFVTNIIVRGGISLGYRF
jgi:hypothetical protein